MEVRIEEKDAFNIVGVTKRVPIRFEGLNAEIIELAQSITASQHDTMNCLNDLYPHQVVNASFDFDDTRFEGKGELTHMIGFITAKDNPTDELKQLHVESGTWAVFPSTGPFPQTLQDIWGMIYAEWLPESDYIVTAGPEISFTQNNNSEIKYSEIWLPVKKK
ncbi:GyrI-like domain-containing protein [Macrococcus equipercicus]|uniref:GyrI-like domain-containing protein n=1 Tax=Macrococcus equipercicus TaxID=69967 RepID=A0A9Q9BU56_9STAP|nr:GyrI-like domain-containing protein [Macrococcus equipercicus]UTH14121.1 GyrI-like domain-containing protein [Macrococcus equipercicus]